MHPSDYYPLGGGMGGYTDRQSGFGKVSETLGKGGIFQGPTLQDG